MKKTTATNIDDGEKKIDSRWIIANNNGEILPLFVDYIIFQNM